MEGSKIGIWFFIGLLLTLYGVLIVAAGTVEWVTGNYAATVQLTHLHASIWWGGVLLALGLFYLIRFRPVTGRK